MPGTKRNPPDEGRPWRPWLAGILLFSGSLYTMTLTGAELESCLARALSGARSGLDASGLVMTVDLSDGRPELSSVQIGAEPLDREREYRVTTNSFLAGGGDGYDELERGSEPEIDPIVMRTMLEEAMRAVKSVTPPTDVRLVVVGRKR